MICTWRYSSYKDFNVMRKPALGVIFFAAMIYLIWNFSEPVLLLMASTFVLSGMVTRITSQLKRGKQSPPEEAPQAT